MLPEPKFTRLRNKKLYDWLNTNAPGKKVLNLGSGVGNFDSNINDSVKMINLDINMSHSDLDIVADAHRLPFRDGSIDVVYSIAVLEHVKKPWIVAAEITRVLKKGGHVVLELPFLNVIHDEHDYFRFTDKGIRSLFDEHEYEAVLEQVGSGGGSFLSAFLHMYCQQFVPTKYVRKAWRGLMKYPFSWLKFLDIFIDKSSDLRITANSFTFIGKKL